MICLESLTSGSLELIVLSTGASPSPLKTMQDIINVIAISAKGKSRIGTKLVTAIVEQNHHDKMFVVFNASQCRWIKKDNDPDFRIIGDD